MITASWGMLGDEDSGVNQGFRMSENKNKEDMSEEKDEKNETKTDLSGDGKNKGTEQDRNDGGIQLSSECCWPPLSRIWILA